METMKKFNFLPRNKEKLSNGKQCRSRPDDTSSVLIWVHTVCTFLRQNCFELKKNNPLIGKLCRPGQDGTASNLIQVYTGIILLTSNAVEKSSLTLHKNIEGNKSSSSKMFRSGSNGAPSAPQCYLTTKIEWN